MTNTYKALTEIGEHYYGTGELDLSVTAEKDALDAGHLEIVPREYKVLSHRYEAGKQGEVVKLALRMETESALIQGGHIERVDKPAAKAAEKKETK